MTSTLSTWIAEAGALVVTVKPLRPFLAKPRLSLISPSEERDFPFLCDGETLTAVLPEVEVERLLLARGTWGAPHLVLGMRALFQKGAPSRRWQWGIRLAQDGAALTGYGRNRISMPADGEGFVRSKVHAFPQGRAHGYEEWELVLDQQAGLTVPWHAPAPMAAHAGR